MGTIKNGFWKLAFIITPDEFKQFIEYAASLGIGTNKKTAEDVIADYLKFYGALVSTLSPCKIYEGNKAYFKQNVTMIGLQHFVCDLLPHNEKIIGFAINPANMVHWPFYREAVRISNWAVQISCVKGVAVTVNENHEHDENGKYFIYEDIALHSPQSFSLYRQLTNYIKSITKPLRFNAHVIDDVEEIKPPVRISQNTAADLENSWIFKTYEFEMRSYKPKKK